MPSLALSPVWRGVSLAARYRSILLAALLVSLPVASRAADGDGNPAAIDFTLADIEGKAVSGALRTVDAVRVELSGTPSVVVLTDRIVRLARTKPAVSAFEKQPAVLLANGDRLAVRVRRMTEEVLEADWPSEGSGKVRIPLETIRGVIVTAPESVERRWTLDGQLTRWRENSDIVMLARGDRLPGEMIGWTGDALTLKGAAGDVSLERAQILAMGFSASLTSFPKVEGPRQLVVLTDGSQIVMTGLKFAEGHLNGRAAFGADLSFSIESIASIRFLGGRIQPLSDLTPTNFRHTPFVSGTWKAGIDRTVLGRPLRLRGGEYPKGLGMHSQSSMTYAIDGEYESFLATVGIDDETQDRGNVVFAVEVDGKRIAATSPLPGSALSQKIGPLDLRGKRSLTLHVEFGELGDIQDHADWCDPVLVRAKGSESPARD
ncbi:MAG: NPCBM/NEW2 domain-containing protein [Planctomycetaceae bacterium]|nr:NPCBM/NEW2 domain-containing protein [Planctomycetaceae bacterium]